MKYILIWLFAVCICSACVDSRCYRHPDCPAGRVCESGTGRCVIPACTRDSECSSGTVCESYACVEGCVTDQDCPADHRCTGRRCLLFSESCQCSAAPEFCLPDVNPVSPGSGGTTCFPSSMSGDSVVFVFGSVACAHCRDLYRAVADVAGRFQPLSGGAYPVFVNLTGVVVSEDQIESWFTGVLQPILQDTAQDRVWAQFGADWYHLVLVDRNGCLVQHWGPVDAAALSGELGDSLESLWRTATGAECEPAPIQEGSPERSDGNDAIWDVLRDFDVVSSDRHDPEIQSDGSLQDTGSVELVDVPADPDILDDAFRAEDGSQDWTVADVTNPDQLDLCATDGCVSMPDLPADTGLPPEVFTLDSLCQIEQSPPPAVGQPVPHFLCMDRNTASSTYGLGISDWTLRESVWIAYFGGCT